MSHALLAPSSAEVWANCPGSVVLSSLVPETDKWKTQSDEGTAAHWVCETVLLDCAEAGTLDTSRLDDGLLGVTAPNGVVVTEDMIRGARLYIEEIDLVAGRVGYDQLMVEQHVQTAIHAECSGTPDAAIIDSEELTIHIWDYKYGHGDVPAYENKQLICYYDGVVNTFGLDNMEHVTVHFHVIQPRCFTSNGPVKEWIVEATDLRGELNILRGAAARAVSDEAETVSGNHCRHCPARHECKSARLAALDAVAYQNTVQPEPLSDDAIAYETLALENAMASLKYRKEAMHDEIASRIAAGRSIQYFTATQGQGHSKWAVDVSTLQMIGEGSSVSLIKDPEGVTPAEAKRRLMSSGMKGKEADSTLAGLTTRPSTGMKVVRTKGTEATQIFSKTTGASV
jgi:hypothetical protein